MSLILSKNDVFFTQRFLRSAGLYMDKLDGKWGKNTDAAMRQFESTTAGIQAKYGTFDFRSEQSIASLHPAAQTAARLFLKKVLDGGIQARILSGTRTYAEQDALYRQGRFGNPGPIVTKARGGQSNHNFGIAWDIGIFDNGKYLGDSPLYDAAATFATADGIEWGGNWKTLRDRPHYQLATGLAISDIRSRFEQGKPFVG
jgi:peptidoglycan L-alanyl-D-glutamate endopeptidase CwlK